MLVEHASCHECALTIPTDRFSSHPCSSLILAWYVLGHLFWFLSFFFGGLEVFSAWQLSCLLWRWYSFLSKETLSRSLLNHVFHFGVFRKSLIFQPLRHWQLGRQEIIFLGQSQFQPETCWEEDQVIQQRYTAGVLCECCSNSLKQSSFPFWFLCGISFGFF